MKTRPILFGTDMVRAILRGQKKKTRRPVHPSCEIHRYGLLVTLTRPDRHGGRFAPCGCPFGSVGDHLWVREAFARHPLSGKTIYRADGEECPYGDGFDWKPKWTPSIHMPRELSRITLEITQIGVFPLQDMDDAEALLEGMPGEGNESPRKRFAALWDAMYAKHGFPWEENPRVWVISFEPVA